MLLSQSFVWEGSLFYPDSSFIMKKNKHFDVSHQHKWSSLAAGTISFIYMKTYGAPIKYGICVQNPL